MRAHPVSAVYFYRTRPGAAAAARLRPALVGCAGDCAALRYSLPTGDGARELGAGRAPCVQRVLAVDTGVIAAATDNNNRDLLEGRNGFVQCFAEICLSHG